MAKDTEKKQAKRRAKAEKRARRMDRKKHSRKAQAVLSRPQIAEQLRILASQVEAGTFVLGDQDLDLPPYADFEVSYKPKKWGGHQIEVEIEWGGPTDAPLLSGEE
jgi:amphi-Trp domain-containing protein